MQYVHAFRKLLFMPSELTLGAEYSFDELEDRSIGYDIDTDQTVHIVGGYLQNEWKTKKWSLLVGGRVDKHNLVDHAIFSPRANVRFKSFGVGQPACELCRGLPRPAASTRTCTSPSWAESGCASSLRTI